METTTSAQHTATDPAIHHSEPTLCDTRILVADVPEQVESGVAWEAIIEEWRYEIDKRCDCRSSPQSHVIRPPLMRQSWFLSR